MSEALKHTPLYDEHVALGGKIVPFAGYALPVQYPTGITAEHHAVRGAAGLFDVSHMGEFVIRGGDALALVQHLTVNDASRLEVGQCQYSAMCREDGGIIDDLVVYRFPEHYMLVVNGARRDVDWAWVREHATAFDVEVEDRSDALALLALQGPVAQRVLAPLTDVDLDALGYYRFAEGTVAGVDGVVSRTGYTGEDGFELYLPVGGAVAVWRALLEQGRDEGLLPAGLGARDTLRLEMGYALYGNDLDEEHTPLEGRLGWVVKLDKGDFVGREALARQKEQGVSRRLVGLQLTERGFPRPHYPIVHEGADVGEVTSGTVSPTLGHGIAMGYVPADLGAAGTALGIRVRDRVLAAEVVRPPFYTGGSIRR